MVLVSIIDRFALLTVMHYALKKCVQTTYNRQQSITLRNSTA